MQYYEIVCHNESNNGNSSDVINVHKILAIDTQKTRKKTIQDKFRVMLALVV